MAHDEGRVIKATNNACRILESLREFDEAGVTELAEELDYSQSAVHAQLNTLKLNGLVVQNGNKYRLSFQFLDLAQHVVSQFGDFDIIRSEVDSLAKETGEVAQFVTDERGKIVHVHKAKGSNAVKTGSFMGKREPLHSTAMGKAILSTKSTEEIDGIIRNPGLAKKTDRTATTRSELLDRLEMVQERGYAIDDGENVRGIRCIAVPIMTSEENLGSLGVTGPSSRMSDERLETELIDAVQSSANIIEVNYKFS